MEEKNITKYVAYEAPLKDFIKMADENSHRYDRHILYEYKANRPDMTPEQIEIQNKNRWYANRSMDIQLSSDLLYEMAKEEAYDTISKGCKNNIPKTIFNNVLDTNIRAVVTIKQYTDDASGVEIDVEAGEQKALGTYIYDIKELEKELKGVKRKDSFMTEDKTVYLDNLNIGMYSYAFERIGETITKMINKVMRENFTYCMKNGVVIVPEEYLAKGKDGIEEWRSIKSANNKSNSMEKRMIKQVFAEKRQFATKCMIQIIDKVVSVNHNWSLPCVTVDGRWNMTKINKLVTKIANTKNKQKFIDMPDEEIIEKFKKYWKKELMDIYDEIDTMEVLKIKQ